MTPAQYRDRLIALETDRRNIVEDIKEIGTEMKAAGLSDVEIKGVKLAVRRNFETDPKRMLRESVESFAASLGQLADLPLGVAAIGRAA